MRRSVRILLLALALVAFLAVSVGLARVLNANGAERSAIVALIEAQARGDAPAMVARIDGCARRPDCVASARANAAGLRAPGRVELVRLDASTSFSLGGTSGVARVVWKTPSRETVVQCVSVRRGGDVIGGLSVLLRALSRPIGHQSACPSAS
ncbi:MAG: hypothetical protein JSS99_00630 [Actinobacteria bacterium]|nr:hypothetical protein [Actinomycetota bacterium]